MYLLYKGPRDGEQDCQTSPRALSHLSEHPRPGAVQPPYGRHPCSPAVLRDTTQSALVCEGVDAPAQRLAQGHPSTVLPCPLPLPRSGCPLRSRTRGRSRRRGLLHGVGDATVGRARRAGCCPQVVFLLRQGSCSFALKAFQVTESGPPRISRTVPLTSGPPIMGCNHICKMPSQRLRNSCLTEQRGL